MMRRFLSALLAMVLVLSLLPVLPTQAAEPIVYNGNEMAPFAGRTRQQIGEAYGKAMYAGPSYRNRDEESYYSVQPSLKAPYEAGTLTEDTVATMDAMTNFFRWLVGTKPLTEPCQSTEILQKGALVRNWQFDHWISDNSKPDDMDQSLWDEGASAGHNILAWNSTPRGAITNWLNEGYNTYSESWDTIGHREALISPYYQGLDFGYSGRIAIGNITTYNNYAPAVWGDNAFSAFPAPGLMPMNVVQANYAAWTVDLNRNLLKVEDTAALTVRVTDVNSGESYLCTEENDKLSANGTIAFVQPSVSEGDYYYADGSVYRVDITGLTDVATGEAAQITYTVEFFDVKDYSPSIITGYNVRNWNTLKILESRCTTQNLQMLAQALPREVNVTAETGRTATIPTTGAWTLDEEHSCWINHASASDLPDGLTDPDQLLGEVRITYRPVDYTGSFSAGYGTEYAGHDYTFRLWQYFSSSCTDIYHYGNGQAELRYTQDSDNYLGRDEYGYLTWSHTWSVEDSGTWFAIYYSPWWSAEAYVTGLTEIEVVCLHESKHTVVTDPTCLAAGKTEVICDVCADVLSTTEIPILPHEVVDCTVGQEPTQQSEGSLIGTCRLCGNPQTIPLPALNTQDYTYLVTAQPDCYHEGEGRYTWNTTTYGSFAFTVVLPKTEHDFDAVVTAPTCLEIGFTTHTCPICHDVYTDSEVPALGHSFLYEITAEPTAETEGLLLGLCERCDAEDAVILPALTDENYTYSVQQEPVCRETGVGTYTWNNTDYGPVVITETIPALDCPTEVFPDVKTSAWYHTAADWAVGNGYINGIEGKFAATTKANRAMLVTILHRMAGAPVVEFENPFEDVKANQYYYNAVMWAAKNGIVTGKTESRFAPKDLLTREQAATILYRYAQSKGIETTGESDLSIFPDGDKLAAYAKDAMNWAVANGIINGNSIAGVDMLDAKGRANRGQLAIILMNFDTLIREQ